jgi:putative endonuclease
MKKAPAGKQKRRAAYGLGHRGERLAAWALRLKGFRILARRYRTPSGEIDLIARRGDLVAIVEVKARPTLRRRWTRSRPMRCGASKPPPISGSSRQPDHARLSLRFDLVAVLPRRWPVHVVNIAG